MGELAETMGVAANRMTAVKKAGAPFPLGKSRPEWILNFLAEHPNLQLKEFE
jgi:hypothetical protein